MAVVLAGMFLQISGLTWRVNMPSIKSTDPLGEPILADGSSERRSEEKSGGDQNV